MTISSAGLGSGIPIGDLVSQLVAAEAAPVSNRLDRREAVIQTELSAIGLLKSALSDFRSSFAALKESDTFTSRQGSSSDTSVASISVEEASVVSKYSLEVLNLAQAQTIVSQNAYSTAGDGTLTFTNQAGDSFAVTLTTDDATVADIVTAINQAEDNIGVIAKEITVGGESRLVLSADDTGVEKRITSIVGAGTGDIASFDYSYTASVDPDLDGDDSNWDQTVAAEDASLLLEGQLITSASNTLVDVIPNTTITLTGESDASTPSYLSITTSTSGVRSKIEKFVEAYNELASLIAQQTSYNQEIGQAGALQGDSLTRSIQNQLRSYLSGTGSATGSISALANLGITTSRSGSLEIDSAKLAAALSDNFEDVTAFFSDETTGLANRVDTMLGSYLDFQGTFSTRTDSLNKSLSRIDDQRESLSLRLDKLEARYLSQFNAMDALVATLTSTGNFLNQQLQSIAQIQTARYNK